MQFCPNPECSFLLRFGTPSEFADSRATCSDCGSDLVSGVAPEPAKLDPPGERDAWTTIASFRDVPSAYIARARLDAEDVPTNVADEHKVGVAWLYSQAIGGVKLQVLESDVRRARAILEAPQPGEEADSVSYGACPSCGGINVSPATYPKRVGIFSLLLGFPLPFKRKQLSCASCGSTFPADRATAA